MTMYSFPCELKNLDSIILPFQQDATRFLEFTESYSEIIPNGFFNEYAPELMTQIEEFGIKLDIARYFVTVANQRIPIHIDSTAEAPKYWALNLPIYNCANSEMSWYTTKLDYELDYNPMYTPYYIRWALPENCNKEESLELTTPHWVYIDALHDVVNNNPVNRVIVSMRFDSSFNKDWHPSLLK